MFRRLTLVILVLFLITCYSTASAETKLQTKVEEPKWMADINPIMPVLPIYILRVARSVGTDQWLSFGYAYQVLELDAGTTHSNTLTLGYRRFFKNGWNAELEIWPAWDDFESSVDGKTYSGWEVFVAARFGWMWIAPWWEERFFVNSQIEIGYGACNTNPWPELYRGPSPFPVVTVGYRW